MRSPLIHLVRSASLRGYPELARSLGLDPFAMMRRVGLRRDSLDDPETRISADRVARLLELSAAQTGIEAFGLRLASTRHVSNLGPLALVLRQEPTGLAALETLCRHANLLNTSLFTQIETHPGIVIVSEQVMLDRPAPARQATELAVGVMFRVLCDILGAAWKPRGVGFTHRAPTDSTVHQSLFGARVEFEAGFNGIVCSRRELEMQLPRTDPDTAALARAFFEHSIRQSPDDPVLAVRRLIIALLPGGRCSVETVAQHMGVDRRTIHRRLLRHGSTFGELLNQVRREFAIRQLSDSNRAIGELAELLGFSGASAFAHWFRSEFACSARVWRATRRGDGAPGSNGSPLETV